MTDYNYAVRRHFEKTSYIGFAPKNKRLRGIPIKGKAQMAAVTRYRGRYGRYRRRYGRRYGGRTTYRRAYGRRYGRRTRRRYR